MSYKYNPYRDTFEHIEDEQPITAYGTGTAPPIPVYTYPITYIADECIEKIADAVVRKMAIFNCGANMRGEQDERSKADQE